MVFLYFDHAVSADVARLLRYRGHYTVTARDIGMDSAKDDVHLLLAWQRGWIFVTHDEGDFTLLHDAWRRWAQAWQVAPIPQHPGILIIPQPWPAPDPAQELGRFLQSSPPLANELYRYRRTRGWERRP